MTVDFTGITLPFDGADVLSSAMGFIGVVASLVILGIVVRFTPAIISVIKSALGRSNRA